jgi:ketosteroid isomerase-like protein
MTNKQGETDMPSAPDETTISEVLAAEDERIAAIHAGDWDRVGEFLGDDLSYTHMSGKLENKAENMAQNAAVRRSYKHTDILVRPFGDTAVMNSGLEVTVAPLPDGTPERLLLGRAIQVFAKRDGKWQMIAFQATAVPPVAP